MSWLVLAPGATTRYRAVLDSERSALLDEAGFRHAFFTRRGGVSQGPYESLNFSYGVGDDRALVDTNFRRAEEALRLAPERLVFASQVHGALVNGLSGEETRSVTSTLEGDALTSDCPTLGLGVRSADCVPILIGDTRTGRATAVHAGWRGLVAGVIAEAVRVTGNDPRGFVAAVGPHIGPLAFEVSQEVAQALLACSSALAPIVNGSGPRPHVDLRGIAHAQLLSGGLAAARIDDVLGCTWSEPQRFFSFRRDGPNSGRHLSAIVPLAR